MYDTSLENSWAHIESMSQAILAAASERHWNNVLELSSRRHLELQDHFTAYPIGPDRAEFYRVRIDTMLRGENELQKIIIAARKALMSEGVSAQQSNRAVGAYLDTAIRGASTARN